jgi:hypothetical protein
MVEMVAPCGLNCLTCPIYLATRVEDAGEQREMRTGIANQCREQYKLNFELEDISNCDGCLAGGRLFPACKDCPIRRCAKEKGLNNCVYCSEYPCKDLRQFFQTEPAAKDQLERIRRKRAMEGE